MLRRLLTMIALTAILTSAGCVHHRHFARHHGDCCNSCCPSPCGPGPAFVGP